MKDQAIQNAINPNFDNGTAFTDGNVVVGVATNHVAIAFNQTTYNQNQVVVLQQRDAYALFALLLIAGRKNGWIQ